MCVIKTPPYGGVGNLFARKRVCAYGAILVFHSHDVVTGGIAFRLHKGHSFGMILLYLVQQHPCIDHRSYD